MPASGEVLRGGVRAGVVFRLAITAIAVLALLQSDNAAARSKGATAQQIANSCQVYPRPHDNGKMYSAREYAHAYQQLLAQTRQQNPAGEEAKRLSDAMQDIRQCDGLRAARAKFAKAAKSCTELEKSINYIKDQLQPMYREGVFGQGSWAQTYYHTLLKQLKPALAKCLGDLESKCIRLEDPHQVRMAKQIHDLGVVLMRISLPKDQQNDPQLERKLRVCPKSTTRRCATDPAPGYTCEQYFKDADQILRDPINEKLWFRS